MIFAGAVLLLVGAAFCALGALGVLRFPDLYTRLHAASKAGALGAGLILMGAGVASGDPWTLLRCAFGLVFLILTSPVSAHLLARAALLRGDRPPNIASINEFQNNK